jgi:putative hydrolase of the HAD superfamily
MNGEISVVFFDIGGTLVRDGHSQTWVTGAKEALTQLSQTDLRLGLISNTGDLDRTQLAAILPGDFDFQLFDDDLILLSSEIGIEKPDIRIFLQAIRQAATSPHRCIFIGENMPEVFVAQRAGMRAIRIFEKQLNDLTDILSLLG